MLDLVIIVLALTAFFAMKEFTSVNSATRFFYGLMVLLMLLSLAASLLDFYSTYSPPPASLAGRITVNSNTVYQNDNESALFIYAYTEQAGEPITAWIGKNSLTTHLVSATYAQIGTGLLTVNETSLIVVPAFWYYKYNYTSCGGCVIFTGEYTNTT